MYAPVKKLVSPPCRRHEWIWFEWEVYIAGQAICIAFAIALAVSTLAGVITLAYAPKADVNFADLSDATCLRVSRLADYTTVFVDVGSPMQRVKLLLDLGSVVDVGGESLTIFSSRLHKSVSMSCGDLTPHRHYSQKCQDLALVAPNGSSSDQILVHTEFIFQNDQSAYSERQPAAIAGLDGTFRLTRNVTYWLSTTHLCFAPLAPPIADTGVKTLKFSVDNGMMHTTQLDLKTWNITRWKPEWVFGGLCDDALVGVRVRMFPTEAANEARVWLTLSGTFLYEYGSSILEKRREVVEAGEHCSALLEDLNHQRDIYHSDCGLGLGDCAVLPSVPFRRLATRRIRIDVPTEGNGTIITEHAVALENLKKSYVDALTAAIARLFVLLLTAAVVFVRGSQNATSSRWLLINLIDTLRCRGPKSEDHTPESVISRYDEYDIITDALISVAAWGSRLVVLVFSATSLQQDGQGTTVYFQILGLVCSFIHFLLRSCLDVNRKREAPITTLGGPMSVIDVTSAVIILFSEAPLLGSDGQKFTAIGRLLIGLLISLSVCTRICFSVSMVATMAVAATWGNRKALKCHKMILVISTVLWLLQSISTSGSLVLLFVNPAAVALSRSQTGDTRVVKYAIYLGLVCTSLPTFTKIGLRVYQHELNRSKEE